ncbi:hypothetical protein Ndes2437B_g02218 [Nannochloris sp. 'desiccata']
MGRVSRSSAIILALLGCIAAATAYSCDPATCVAPNCHCASGTAPLPVEQMPQFIVYTHDDSTAELSTGLINQTITGYKNPNGCAIPVTYFTMQGFTDCAKVQAAWKTGSEIATHTWSHLAMPPGFKGGLGSIDKEIASVKDWLINNCSIPAADVVGFRSPFLVHNPTYRQALLNDGFLYDSSINEHWPMPSSPTGASRLYPYTMDAGIPQDCSWISGNACTATEAYAGLWEVPVWTLQTDTYPTPAYAMDPCTGENGPCDTAQLLKSFFNTSYNGNKAPVPIYIHSPWLSKNIQPIRNFIQWVTSNYPDAYFVTMHQLVQWMENPVPKNKMNDWLGCVPGGNAAGAVGAGVAAPAPAPAPQAAPAAPVPEAKPVAPAAPLVEALPAPTVVPAAARVDPNAVPAASSATQLQRSATTFFGAVAVTVVAGFMQFY